MTEWTVPESGWYECGPGGWRKISDEEAAAMFCDQPPGDPQTAAVLFGTEGGTTTAWSAATKAVRLPGGQTLPPMTRTVIFDTVPAGGLYPGPCAGNP